MSRPELIPLFTGLATRQFRKPVTEAMETCASHGLSSGRLAARDSGVLRPEDIPRTPNFAEIEWLVGGAFQRLIRSSQLHPLHASEGLAELERKALVAHLLAEGNQPADALHLLEDVRTSLLGFVSEAAVAPAPAAAQIRQAVGTVGNLELDPEAADDLAIVKAWVLGRGIGLLAVSARTATAILVEASAS